jgi:deazaflavin-dependent oxidoreductase (nitroreductase family)
MASFRRWFMRAGNRFGVWLYRILDGRLSSGRRGVTVLLITSPGRRTGRARSTCVRYLDTPDGWLVWGTGAGSRRDPDWFENLRATPAADVQIRSRHVAVRATELTGPERDATWRDVVLAAAPEVTRYARKAGRTIPVAVLRPREDADTATPVESA